MIQQFYLKLFNLHNQIKLNGSKYCYVLLTIRFDMSFVYTLMIKQFYFKQFILA